MAAFERDSPTDLLSIDRRDTDTLVVRVRGTWHLKHGMPFADALETQFATQEPPHKVSFDASALTHSDSSLVNFVTKLVELCHDHQVATDLVGLPPELQRIVKLAETGSETQDPLRGEACKTWSNAWACGGSEPSKQAMRI